MRRISKLSVLCLAAGVVNACSLPDEVITTENIPTAGVRFINAVPDTNTVDFRFVDIVESNAHFRIGFRNNPVTSSGVTASSQIQYKNARAGSRHFVVFLDDTIQATAQTKLFDSTFTFDVGKLYTVLMQGNARSAAAADKLRLTISEENVADPGAQVALRIINATSGAIDGRQFLSTGTTPATATWAAVPAYTASAYVNVAVSSITGTTTYRYDVRDAGGAAVILPLTSALIGAPASVSGSVPLVTCPPATGGCDTEALPGTSIAGSAVTGVVFPATVAGSKAASFTTKGISFMWDRRPPRTLCSPLC